MNVWQSQRYLKKTIVKHTLNLYGDDANEIYDRYVSLSQNNVAGSIKMQTTYRTSADNELL